MPKSVNSLQEEPDENKVDFEILKGQISTAVQERRDLVPPLNLSGPSTNSFASSDETEIWPLYLKTTMVEHYIFGDLIGKGSYAEVRECIDMRNLERTAVKIVDRNYLKRQNPRAARNQELELKLLRLLNHENVIHLKGIFTQGSKIYIFLEHCTFVMHDLLSGLPDGRMCVPLARNLFTQLLTGIDYLHSMGVVHRDIKPQNLLITNDGTLKIIDFGVSHLSSIWDRSDLCSNYEGSPLFQAPEVIVSENKYLGTKADIWSAGVTLYLMLFGCYPFFDETLLGLYDYILGEQFRVPDKPIYHDHKKIVIDFISRMLDKNPVTRSSISELLSHPWMNYHRDLLDCNLEHVDFSHFSAQRIDESMNHVLNSGQSLLARDIYRSTSCLPYLYNYHFPEHRATKPSTPSGSNSSQSLSSNVSSPESSPHEVIEDQPVEWGTKKQFRLLKVPHVRVNRIRLGQKSAAIQRRYQGRKGANRR